MDADYEPITFQFPAEAGASWLFEMDMADPQKPAGARLQRRISGAARALALFRQPLDQELARDAAAAPARVARREMQQRRRRAGVVIPLFSIRSPSQWGLGDIADIPKFADWASQAGFSVLQLLPVNEVSGADASPYAALSAFALDPVYLSLEGCEDFLAAGGRDALSDGSRAKLAELAAAPLVDWTAARALKNEGITLAFRRFLRDEWTRDTARARQLTAYMTGNRLWLDDYALFSVWHAQFGGGVVRLAERAPRSRPARPQRGAPGAPRGDPADQVGAVAAGSSVAQRAERGERLRASS